MALLRIQQSAAECFGGHIRRSIPSLYGLNAKADAMLSNALDSEKNPAGSNWCHPSPKHLENLFDIFEIGFGHFSLLNNNGKK